MALIKKGNNLIGAKYNLSLNEQRLILHLCSKIQMSDTDFHVYSFTLSELAELTHIDRKFIYAEIKDIARKLLSKPITFFQTNDILICNWCSSFRFNEESGEVKIKFDPDLKPFLLDLKQCFTTYEIKNIVGFTSKYSFRIYEICKQNQKLKMKKMSIVELKTILDIENKYTRILDLKNRVVTPALKDINKFSDLTVSAKYHKTGRRITHIEFIITNGLQTCQNERQATQILQEKQEQTVRTAKAAKTIKTNSGLKARWDALTEEEKKQWGAGAKAFANFRGKKGIWQD